MEATQEKAEQLYKKLEQQKDALLKNWMMKKNELHFLLLLLHICSAFQSCAQSREVKLNPEHRFEFDACEMRYNEQAFKLGDSIDKFIELFGPYSRMVDLAHDTYVWDTLGVSVYVPWDKQNVIEMNFIFDFQREINEYPPDEEFDFERQVQEDIQAAIPRHFFSGGILVGGVAIDNKSTIDEYNDQSEKFYFPKGPMSWRRKIIFTDCDPSRMSYFMDIADDGKTIERFGVSDHTILGD